MQPLRLPGFEVKSRDNLIFCLVRKKWVMLTSEEWVRQHFLNLLFAHLGYPRGMTRLENTMNYFKNQKRSDITILDRDGKVFLLVECKSSNVKLDEKVVSQLAEYNKVLDSEYLAITNGINHFVWKKSDAGFQQIREFPFYYDGA